MTQRKLRIASLALICALLLPLQAQNVSRSARRAFIWKVKSDKATAYLLGSVHVAKSDIYPLGDNIEKAFKNSDVLVVEADINAESPLAMASQMLPRALYQGDDKLENHISEEMVKLVTSKLEESGLPAAYFLRFKPWFIASMLTLMELKNLGITPENGIDSHFLERARGEKQILELESVSAQLELLDSFSDREQETFLLYTLKDLENVGKNLDSMMNAWLRGDERSFTALLNQAVKETPASASIYKKLISDRNHTMAARIEEYLNKEHTYFIVVGAGHLVGDDGLIKLLSRSHDVKQM
ncbi:MAG TPA: TraB/GumN family protein [Acidobacteriota bacterium]|jgi:hypothetical protein